MVGHAAVGRGRDRLQKCVGDLNEDFDLRLVHVRPIKPHRVHRQRLALWRRQPRRSENGESGDG